MRLETPEKIRDLQEAVSAERSQSFAFVCLRREDILQHAYRLVRANGGARASNGVTFRVN